MDQILILHAPDEYDSAKLLCYELELIGFLSTTFSSLYGNTSRTVAQQKRWEFLDTSPAIIIIGSRQLFEVDFFSETALLSSQTGIAVFITYDQPDLELPVWFQKPIHLKVPGTDTSHAWNQLVQRLIHLTGPFVVPVEGYDA